MSEHTFYPDLLQLVGDITPDTILSRTIQENAGCKTVLFAFAPGQALSEHIATMPAIIHILQGEATLSLGDQVQEVSAGAWAYMNARLPHSVQAHSAVIMLLTMLKGLKE